jgi:hypothetical protein
LQFPVLPAFYPEIGGVKDGPCHSGAKKGRLWGALFRKIASSPKNAIRPICGLD